MKIKQEVVIPLPTLKHYPIPPKSQKGCKEWNCPKCEQPVWLSEKKSLILMNKGENFIVTILCYDCMEKNLKEKAEKIQILPMKI